MSTSLFLVAFGVPFAAAVALVPSWCLYGWKTQRMWVRATGAVVAFVALVVAISLLSVHYGIR